VKMQKKRDHINFSSYDAVVVGTGFGGSACAYALAQSGLKVLMLERGDWARRDTQDWNAKAILIEKSYQGPSALAVKQYKDSNYQTIKENEVVGGMSVFYGGASLRLREKDFEHWPISYGELEPFYAKAEQILEVHGVVGEDPCEPSRSQAYAYSPIDLTPPAERIFKAGRKLGLSPFQMPMAINFSNTSRTTCIRCLTCDGFPCQIEAKNDLTKTFLKQAVLSGVDIVVGIQVVQVVESGGQIKTLRCVDRATKKEFEISAPIVIVAGGALQSPALLLRSSLNRFSQNHLIGRYLMRHCNAVVAGVFPFRTNVKREFHKQICFTDFYEDFRAKDEMATGVVQDIYSPDPVVLKHFAPRGLKNAAALSSKFLQNLLCVAEDEPQYENGVSLSKQADAFGVAQAQITHHYSKRDGERRDYLIGKAKQILRKAGALFFHVYHIDTFSHGVGSVRMGSDPADSVLDVHCRFRDIDNLFVVDGSVFPTSGGVNPSLTIAANALRVGTYISKTYRNI
jgi:choline dehydrogenase-like flavoprotein